MRFSLEVPAQELELNLCLNSGQVFRFVRTETGVWEGVDGLYWFRIEERPEGELVRLDVESNGSEQSFRSVFRLDEDLSAVQREILALGPELEPYIGELHGLRMMRCSDPHETLFCFLCTANNHLSRIVPMVQRLAGYGEPLERNFTVFPTVQRIASIPEQELRSLGFGYRGKTIPIVAHQLLERGDGWLESLKGAGYEAAQRELCGLYGVGKKLADCICLYGLHYTESTPFDTHLWQAVTRVYFPQWRDTALTEAKYRAAGEFMRERFGKLAGYAHLFLYFENLRNWRKRK